MKRAGQITGILLMLLLAGNTNLNAQRGMRGGMDTTRLNRPGRDAGMRQMRDGGQHGDSLFNRRMHEGFRPGPMHGNMRGQVPGHQFGMRKGMTPPPFDRQGLRPFGSGGNRLESIANLTDKQKSEIAALRVIQQGEMKKFRDDIDVKMKTLREEHRKKMLGLLTEDQRKQLEPAGIVPATPKAK
jgi:hypothetical protein